MEAFGVRFRIDRQDLFPALLAMFDELKQAKDSGRFGEADRWAERLAPEARTHFDWPSRQEQKEHAAVRASHPVAITEPADALGQGWDFPSLLAAIESGEYSLTEIVQLADGTAELRINPEAYPYGGLGCFIALVEAHGMYVLGVNEYGEYQSREKLLESTDASASSKRKPWWKFWG